MDDYHFKPKTGKESYGWHSRRLPHLDAEIQAQFVTFRLFDSMPAELVERWRIQALSETDFRKRVEKYLDAGYGECWLQQAEVAGIVHNALQFWADQRYRLDAWVIMPNHCHILLAPFVSEHLPDIMHSIKSFTAQKANVLLGRRGQFWQHESFDRYIRDPRHFAAVVRYIENNPVKARLCTTAGDWRFSSAFGRRND